MRVVKVFSCETGYELQRLLNKFASEHPELEPVSVALTDSGVTAVIYEEQQMAKPHQDCPACRHTYGTDLKCPEHG